jgi:transcriptional regulator with XRE-family HTH domain
MPGQRGSPGESIRTLRQLAGLSLEAVASTADTSTAYLSKVETGKLVPTKSYVAKVTTAIAAHLRDAA